MTSPLLFLNSMASALPAKDVPLTEFPSSFTEVSQLIASGMLGIVPSAPLRATSISLASTVKPVGNPTMVIGPVKFALTAVNVRSSPGIFDGFPLITASASMPSRTEKPVPPTTASNGSSSGIPAKSVLMVRLNFSILPSSISCSVVEKKPFPLTSTSTVSSESVKPASTNSTSKSASWMLSAPTSNRAPSSPSKSRSPSGVPITSPPALKSMTSL